MLNSLKRIANLVWKEFLIVSRDPKARLMLIGPPIIQLIIFSFATTLEVKNLPVMIVNLDYGVHGYELSERIMAARVFEKARFYRDERDVDRALDLGEILFAVTIPEDFSKRILRGEGAKVRVIHDGRKSNAAQIADGYLGEIAAVYSLDLQGIDGGYGGGDDNAYNSEGFIVRNFFNPNLDHVWTTIPSLTAILTLIMTLSISALSLAREKELGTFEELLVTPHKPYEILIGKFIPAMMVGTMEALFIHAMGRALFGAPFRGSFLLLLVSIILFSYGIVGFGLLISVLARTQQQAILGSFIFIVPAVALSGFAAPVDNMPLWLQKAVFLNPLKHGIFILKGIFLKDLSAADLLRGAWPLAFIGTLTLLSAAWIFMRRKAG
jgi:ABC-2 type transport system permease protein